MEIPQDNGKSRQLLLIVFALSVTALVLYFIVDSWSQIALANNPQDKLLFTQVRQSSLESNVATYGLLKPKVVTSVIAKVTGTAELIHARPGDIMQQGDVIVTLINPKLKRKLEEVELLGLERQAEHQKLITILNQDEVVLKSELTMAQLEQQLALVELDANAELHQKNIISDIEFKKATLLAEQSSAKLALAKHKLSSFYITEAAQLKTSEFKLQQVDKQRGLAAFDIENLNVTANLTGTVNDLNEAVQPGMHIVEGTAIGQMINPNELYGELDVSAAFVAEIALGQKVTLNVKGEPMFGRINRISPNVIDNKVKVDVELLGDLVKTARANIEVTGTIVTNEIATTLVSQQLTKVTRANMEYELYVKPKDKDAFELRTVQIGQITQGKMQILHGASIGDLILLNVPDKYNGLKLIDMES